VDSNRKINKGKKMKRQFSILAVLVVVLAAGSVVLAQSDPFVGTWKLNVAASKFDPGPAPQSQTRTWDPSGSVNITGVNAAGKTTGYSYTIKGDGKDYPTGGAIPNGSDTISSKKVSANEVKATFTKAGKQVESTTFTVSKDGKTLVIVAKGVLPTGQNMNNETHWDKQ
jgi:hypothetical protein